MTYVLLFLIDITYSSVGQLFAFWFGMYFNVVALLGDIIIYNAVN